MPAAVVVTGAAGFVGANLVRRLLERGDRVHAIVRPAPSAPVSWRLADVTGDVEVVPLDLRDQDAVRAALDRVAPATVFHLAAHGAYSWQTGTREILETNVLASAALVEAAVRAGATVVQAGSSSEYGFQDGPAAETELPRPNSAYAVGKVAATMYGQWVAARDGARVTTLRLYSAYGPWEEPGRLVPTLLVHAFRGTLPPLVAPDTARDFVFVDDVCDAFLRAAATAEPGAVLNVGSGRQVTLREIVGEVVDLFGLELEPEWRTMESRTWDTRSWVSDPRRAARELGWTAATPLRDGLARTAEWLRADEKRLQRYASAR